MDMAVFLILLGAVLPLLITPGLLFHYDVTPKTLALTLAALLALTRVRQIPSEVSNLWSRRSGRILVGLAAAGVIWVCVAAALSARPLLSLLGSGWREFGVMTFVLLMICALLAAAHLCRCPEHTRLFLRSSVFAGLIASIYGIAQYFDVDPFQAAAAYHAHAGDSVIVRPPGTFGHADYFGWWLAINFFCAVATGRNEKSWWRLLGISAAATTAVAVLLTGTRAALLAIAAGVIVLMLLEHLRLTPRLAFGVLTVASLAAVFFFSSPGARLRARVAWAGEEPLGGARPLLWRDSLRMAAAKPLTGFGPEMFFSDFARYESRDLAQLYPDFHHESPHNVALDAFTSSGIPGLLLTLGWALLAFHVAVGAWRTQPAIGAPLAAAVLASGIGAAFSAAVMPPILLTLLLIAALTALERPGRPLRPAPVPRWTIGFAVPLVTCFAAFACLLAVADYRLARFQHHPGTATYESVASMPFPVVPEDIYCSRTLADNCRIETGLQSKNDCWRTAIRAAARATTTADDTANAWYNLALFTAAQNDIGGTRKALAKATEIAPNWSKPHSALARLLVLKPGVGEPPNLHQIYNSVTR